MKFGLTHTAKCPKSGGEDICPILSDTLFVLHHLCHEIAHLFRCAILHLPCDVGVGAKREARAAVAEHRGNGFHVHAGLQRSRGETMSQVMKSNVFQTKNNSFISRKFRRA